MREILGRSALLMALVAGAAAAQTRTTPVKQSGVPTTGAAVTWGTLKGDWVGKSMLGRSDSVITTFTTTFSADKKVWVTFPKRPRVSARLVAMGGDSVVFETEPYDSFTRPGHKTTVWMTAHVHGNTMSGTFHGTFDDKQTVDGHSEAMRKAK